MTLSEAGEKTIVSITNFLLSDKLQHIPQSVSHIRVSKVAKIRNRYNQVPHLTQDTNEKVTNSQLDITNENQLVSPFPSGAHNASIHRRARKHNKH